MAGQRPDKMVHYEVSNGIGTITLDSPHNRNALSSQLMAELLDAVKRTRDDESRVVVLRSADRVFCSGGDLSAASGGCLNNMGAETLVELLRLIVTHPKPVVTRLAGPARAGGLGIVAASDIAICADDVTFAFTESRLGLTPAVISLTVLPRMTSRGAYDTFLTGRTFDADEATAIGLITRAVAAGQLDDEITRVCSELLEAHPQGLRETKTLLARDILARIDEQAEEMAGLSARLFASDEARTAMSAFLNRKKSS
ncbi:enoyl-CoA hydratase-related protein [Dietzia cercidiphylli]|uniref:enoyl-CoA hydratase-related protein n=1 Tax=Dietzia cercidiphylli TaxID=498199 RepID=UPI003F7D6956